MRIRLYPLRSDCSVASLQMFGFSSFRLCSFSLLLAICMNFPLSQLIFSNIQKHVVFSSCQKLFMVWGYFFHFLLGWYVVATANTVTTDPLGRRQLTNIVEQALVVSFSVWHRRGIVSWILTSAFNLELNFIFICELSVKSSLSQEVIARISQIIGLGIHLRVHEGRRIRFWFHLLVQSVDLVLQNTLLGDWLASLTMVFMLAASCVLRLLGSSLETLLLRSCLMGHVIHSVRFLSWGNYRLRKPASFFSSLLRVVV